MLDSAEFVSIWFGFSSLIMAIMTVFHYWPKAKDFLRRKDGKDFAGWLSLGIFIGFVGGAIDSSYWQVAWLSEFMKWPSRDGLFRYGVMANIPFRNTVLILSAYCHYRAILIVFPDRSGKEAGYVTAAAMVVGLALAIAFAGFR